MGWLFAAVVYGVGWAWELWPYAAVVALAWWFRGVVG